MKTIVFILSLWFSPYLSILLYLKQSYFLLKSEANPDDKYLIKRWEKIKWEVSNFIKLELGLETIYQLSGQVILLLMAFTATATEDGFSEIFKKGPSQEGEDSIIKDTISASVETIGIDPEAHAIFLLTMSILFSFKTCISSHIKILMAKREYFPWKPKLLAAFYSFFGCTTRVVAIVAFFAPALGLFNLLRHIQAEQTAYDANIEGYFAKEGMIQFGDLNVTWNELDRWQKDPNETIFNTTKNSIGLELNATNPKYLIGPPHYRLFTFFTLGQYFFIFCGILFVQTIFVFLAKCMCCPSFMVLNFFEKTIHAIENINIPFNCQEWDSAKGDAEAHKTRMKTNETEVKVVMAVNFGFNCLLLSPVGILGKCSIAIYVLVYNQYDFFHIGQ